MARFLMATMPITGHFTPGLPIAKALIARGHEVRWYGGRKFQAKIEATGARFIPMTHAPDFDDADYNVAFPGRDKLKDLAQIKFDFKHVFTDPMPGQVRDLAAVIKDYPADALVVDTAFVGAAPLHQLGQGPVWAAFGVTALTVASRDTAPFGLGILPSNSPLGRLRNRALNGLTNRGIFRDVNAHYYATRASLGLPKITTPFLDGPFTGYLYMQGTVPSFEYPRSDLPPQVHFIGPFLPDAPADFTPPAWWADLDSGRPVVHVTQGTVATGAEELIIPTLKALVDEDVLVVATTGGKAPEGLGLNPLPANARVESFIPYYHLLPKVAAMVTNGGYGGVHIALANGIPLVAAGTTEDKPEITNRIAWSGVGINLKTRTPSPDQIREAVRTVLREARYRQRAQALAAEIARYDAPAQAVALLEQLAATKQPVTAATREARPPAQPTAALA